MKEKDGSMKRRRIGGMGGSDGGMKETGKWSDQ